MHPIHICNYNCRATYRTSVMWSYFPFKTKPQQTPTTSSPIFLGNNCLTLKLKHGTFEKSFSVSQKQLYGQFVEGEYTSDVLISQYEGLLSDHDEFSNIIKESGPVTFDETWESNDGLTIFREGKIKFGFD